MGIWQNSSSTVVSDTRVPRHYQMEVLEEIKTAELERHKRCQLVWIPPGSGKTWIIAYFLRWLIDQRRMPRYCVYTLPKEAQLSIEAELDYVGLPHRLLDMRVAGKRKKQNVIQPETVNLLFHDHQRLGDLPEQMIELAPQMMYIADECHKMMQRTQRTSVTLSVVGLSHRSIGLSGTFVHDGDCQSMLEWLRHVVPFEVNPKNYMVAMCAMHARTVSTGIPTVRRFLDAPLCDPDKYRRLIEMRRGDAATLRAIFGECYRASIRCMLERALYYHHTERQRVFMIVADRRQQEEVVSSLCAKGIDASAIHCIRGDSSLLLTPEMASSSPIRFVVTTPRHSLGYTLTAISVTLSLVVFSNQCTREQLHHRTDRLGQRASSLTVEIIRAGVLKFVSERYQQAHCLAHVLRGIATEIPTSSVDHSLWG